MSPYFIMYYTPYNSYQNNYSNMQMPQQYTQPVYRPLGLQGKVVDNLDVVKAMDITMDGSMNYYPLADGTAIATKQLQQDGTSKVVVYKPVVDNDDAQPKYITAEDLKSFNDKELKDMKDDLKTLKRKVEDIIEDLKEKKEK